MQIYLSKSHGENVTLSDVWAAARSAEMTCDNETRRKSRYADTSHTITFSGYGGESRSNRRPNDRGASRSWDAYAATWDQWGILLSVLFSLDPYMKVGGHKHPYYDGADDFHRQTGDRFKRVFTLRDLTTAAMRRGEPGHHDHVFRYDPARGGFTEHVSRCIKGRNDDGQCSAVVVR